jgi:hypothetical protein
MSRGRKPTRPHGRGELRNDSIYTPPRFMAELRIGRHTFASLRKRGLPVRWVGTRAIIDGAEALDFLRAMWQQADPGGPVLIQEAGGRQQ